MPVDLFTNATGTIPTVNSAVATTPAAGTSETWTLTSTASPFPQIGLNQMTRAAISNPTTYPNGDPSPEIVYITAILTSTTVTVLRGQEGSTIKTHAVGDLVYYSELTAAVLSGMVPATKSGQEAIGNQNSIALARIRSALTSAPTTPVNIMVVGASYSEGGTSTTLAGRWVNQFLARLRAKFQPPGVPGGVGYLPGYWGGPLNLPAPAVLTGSPTTGTVSGLGARSTILTTTSTATFTVTGTSVDVCFVNGPTGFGNLSCSVDGAGGTTITNPVNAGGIDMATSRITFAARGTHTVALTGTTTTGCIFDGLIVYDGDESVGVRLYDASHGGFASGSLFADMITGSSYSVNPFNSWCATVQPTLIVIDFCLNDFFLNTNSLGTTTAATTMVTNIQYLITQFRAGCTIPPSIIVLVPPLVPFNPTESGTQPEPLSDFITELYALSSADAGICTFDLSLRMNPPASDTAGLYYSDGVHLSQIGYQYVATEMADFIMAPAPAPPPAAGQQGPTDFQFLGWSTDLDGAASTIKPASGVLMLARVRAMKTGAVGHILYQITTAGATLTSGDSFVGLYDTGQTTPGTATRLAISASQSTIWATAGVGGSAGAATALTSSPTVTAGLDYLVAWVSTGTTPPTFAAGSNLALATAGLTGANLRYATFGTSQTSLPTSFTLSSMAALAASPAVGLLP